MNYMYMYIYIYIYIHIYVHPRKCHDLTQGLASDYS